MLEQPGLTYGQDAQISFRNKSPKRKAIKPKQTNESHTNSCRQTEEKQIEKETSASPRHTVVLRALRCVVLRSAALRYIEREPSASQRHTVMLSAQTLLCCLELG